MLSEAQAWGLYDALADNQPWPFFLCEPRQALALGGRLFWTLPVGCFLSSDLYYVSSVAEWEFLLLQQTPLDTMPARAGEIAALGLAWHQSLIGVDYELCDPDDG